MEEEKKKPIQAFTYLRVIFQLSQLYVRFRDTGCALYLFFLFVIFVVVHFPVYEIHLNSKC